MRAAALSRRHSGGGGGGGGSPSFLSLTSDARPTTKAGATRLVPFTTKTGLTNAIAAAQAGDYIYFDYATLGADLTITSSSTNGFELKNLTAGTATNPVTIDFGCTHNIWDSSLITPHSVKFSYTGSSNFHAFYIHDNSHLRIYGGDYSTNNTGGRGIWFIGGNDDVYMWDYYVHGCGGDATGMMPTVSGSGQGWIKNCWLRGEATDWGHNLSLDPHSDKGTGLHGCQYGDIARSGNAGDVMQNNTLALYAHDGLAGAGIQCGGSTSELGITNSTFYIKLENQTHDGQSRTQTVANAIQFWSGVDLTGTVVGWAEGNNINGRVVKYDATGSATVTVNHGRHSSAMLDPIPSGTSPYDSNSHLVLNDCT